MLKKEEKERREQMAPKEFTEMIEKQGLSMVPDVGDLCMYFDNVKNDGNMDNMIALVNLKNIFSRQLPKMPKEYICKLIFDRRHEAIVIRKKGSKIIGGICFRVYESQKFAEIAFLAISAEEQIRGFGSKLMNQLKTEMQKRGVHFLMTYADNLAIGYFKKQGFHKSIQIPKQIWEGYLKDYDGSTHMECLIDPRINYRTISKDVKRQRDIIISKILEMTNMDVLRKGLKPSHFPANPKDNDNIESIERIPGILQSSWTRQEYTDLKNRPKGTSFKSSCKKIVEQLEKHKSSWPFREPVKKEEVPDYFEIIKRPMDLRTIKENVNASKYKDKESFQQDIHQIFKNAKTYNMKNTIYYKCAVELQQYAENLLNSLKYDFKTSSGGGGTSSRRGGQSEDKVTKKLRKG